MRRSQFKNLEGSPLHGKDALQLLPKKVQEKLMPFQREGVCFALSRDGRCMIADEMGLGKTIQAISVAYIYRQEWPLLIVVPSSLKYPWIEELEKWIPELEPRDINLVESKTDIMSIGTSKVTILGYGLLTTDARPLLEALNKQRFGIVVVDESHYLKSRNAARSKILVPIIQNAKRAILLTGTPALGRPEELFMQIDALYPRRFGTWSDYAKKYCNAHYKYFGTRRQWDCRGASHLDELHQCLSEIMIRRLKNQVLTQLPPKVRQRIPFDLPKDAAKEASASFEQWERLMSFQSENQFVEVMSLITHMYKQTAIAKAGAVKDYIKMMLETEELKFLVFAHHLSMLQACTEAVIEAKAGYIRIDGSVPSAERIQLVHRFQNNPDTRVAILSIQAAGQGLTFTAASHVVFAELYWNPGHIKQAEDRAHRIGQTTTVHIHYLIAKGTFDTVMWAMLNRKETVTGSALNGKKEYLKAEEGDKEKWDFLNFAQAWTPSKTTRGDSEDDKDSLFFSHFERDKQHDIRSFFSPSVNQEKKRKRTADSSSDSLPPAQSPEGPEPNQTTEIQSSVSEANQGEDFSPQLKRFRQVTPLSCRGKKSPLSPLCAPRRLSEGLQAPRHNQKWSCSSCTFSNSGLLLRCEMCETPRNLQRAPSPPSSLSNPPSSASSSLLAASCISDSDHESELPTPSAPARDPNTSTPRTPHAHPSQWANQDEAEMHIRMSQETRGLTPEMHSSGNDNHTHEESDNSFPVYDSLKFCASKNTDRIYIYDKDGLPLHCNFVPLDIRLQNWEELPPEFNHTDNRRQLVRFVREWSSLTLMRQRMVRKSGRVFHSPILLLEELTHSQRRHSSTSRYLSKQDVAQTSIAVAQKEGGAIRIINKDNVAPKRKSTAKPNNQIDGEAESSSVCIRTDSECGYLQALDSAGTPLCLSCQKPSREHSGWAGGFCSPACMEDFQLRSNQSFMRARVLETEQGVCQHCGLNAHQLYLQVRDAPCTHRKEILDNTWLAQLPLKQLNEMIHNPVEGQFWQVDHINPVYRGGGQCSLENLQTLCTVCHRMRTAQQAKDRSQMKRDRAASKLASDITRFFVKK
ncbi:DNA annealing helicase and endonuclease ZRANB3 [Myxocyprinus asiaticus]|uniref:DNA annealing helicase and endonuclease ZRANB3 n=1 Tax=Myxocyprinus asiaticus TaxID=70543 RepID=UPI002222144B|nr:DNA annealing helicase and endonuclease ZRANB3 [Myxocyprinus asiaticus]XP_051549132.1 DNA annealing helicase and endonuclease ZRANB3 [Myxocyprinus asiaticus]